MLDVIALGPPSLAPPRKGEGNPVAPASRFARHPHEKTGMRGIHLIGSGATEKVVRDRESANSTSQANPLYPPPNFCHCGRAVRLPSDNPVSATDIVSCDVGRTLQMSIPGEALALQRGAQFRLRHPYRNGGLDPLVERNRELFGRSTSVNEVAYKRRKGVDMPRPQCSGRGRCGNYHRHGNRYKQEPFSRCMARHSRASTTAAALHVTWLPPVQPAHLGRADASASPPG